MKSFARAQFQDEELTLENQEPCVDANQPARQSTHDKAATKGPGLGWGMILTKTTCKKIAF